MTPTTRRDFARAASLATAASYSRILGANDRVRMGYIGLGNRGDQVHDAFLEHGDAQTVAVCDLRDDYMDLAVSKSRATPGKFADYRKLLEDRSVDAVAIATPDHWHALMFIEACKAGKDVYVEKPLCLTVVEGRKMVDAAEKFRRVTQVGIQRRSTPSLKEAAEFARSGGLGAITTARGFHRHNECPNGIGMAPSTAPPSEREWDQWLGPAPKAPYHRNRTFYNFRWFYDYSGGQLTNFGVHFMDMLRWCLGKEWPTAVVAMGGQFAGIQDNREIPDTLEVLWHFGSAMMIFSQSDANAASSNPKNAEMEVRGSKGTLYLDSGRWEVVPERTTEKLFGFRTPLDRALERSYNPSKKPATQALAPKGANADTAFHTRNFLDCIRSRAKCNCDALAGHVSTSSTIIGNIAHKMKAYLEWDPKSERFTNNREASGLLHYEYRPPYNLG
jgi:predicted dehydrogenase